MRSYSERVAGEIDAALSALVSEAFDQATEILSATGNYLTRLPKNFRNGKRCLATKYQCRYGGNRRKIGKSEVSQCSNDE